MFLQVMRYVETISREEPVSGLQYLLRCKYGQSCIILAMKFVIQKLRMLSEFLEHPFPQLSEEYPMLS